MKIKSKPVEVVETLADEPETSVKPKSKLTKEDKKSAVVNFTLQRYKLEALDKLVEELSEDEPEKDFTRSSLINSILTKELKERGLL